MLCRSYEFEWTPVGALSSSSMSPFRCVTTKGTIGPGRQFEMVFDYTPHTDDRTEAFWVRAKLLLCACCTAHV